MYRVCLRCFSPGLADCFRYAAFFTHKCEIILHIKLLMGLYSRILRRLSVQLRRASSLSTLRSRAVSTHMGQSRLIPAGFAAPLIEIQIQQRVQRRENQQIADEIERYPIPLYSMPHLPELLADSFQKNEVDQAARPPTGRQAPALSRLRLQYWQ